MLTPHMLTTVHMLTPFWPYEKATYLMAQGVQKFFMTKKPTYFILKIIFHVEEINRRFFSVILLFYKKVTFFHCHKYCRHSIVFNFQSSKTAKLDWVGAVVSFGFWLKFLSVCFSGRFLRIKFEVCQNITRNINEKLARLLKSLKHPICWRKTRYVDNSLYVDRFWAFWKSNRCDDALYKPSRFARGNWWTTLSF